MVDRISFELFWFEMVIYLLKWGGGTHPSLCSADLGSRSRALVFALRGADVS